MGEDVTNGRLGIETVLAEADALADDLLERTNRRFARQAEPANDEIIAALFGSRASNALRALHALCGRLVDDQVVVIGRSLTEAVLDLLYLRTPTVRKIDGEAVFLRTIDKEELFITSGIISEGKIRGEVLTVPVEEVDRAKALRRRLGLPAEPVYWHGAKGAWAVLEELKAAESDPFRSDTLKSTYEMFKLFSLGTHSSPLLFNVEEGPRGGWPWQLRRGYSSHEALASSAALAIHVLKIWGDAVGWDVADRAGALISRLGAEP